jgi:dephospho-CoA kinase
MDGIAMKIIGLLGGVASGKSQVARLFRRKGAEVLDADTVGHEVLRMPSVRDAIRHHFGAAVFGADGQVNRQSLGHVVFGAQPNAPQELAMLESLTHPHIRRQLRGDAERMLADGVPAVILDAPVLLKAGWDELCDSLVFVDCPEALRRARAVARGWTAEDFAAREAAQESVEAKRALADFVVDNSGSLGYTQSQIERVWQTLVG